MTLHDIYHYLELDPNLSTSGQPSEAAFNEIAQAGFELVINLALITKDYSLVDEAGLVRRLGMKYIHIPVVWDHPTMQDLRRFYAEMQNHAGLKIFVHCAANMRASVFVALYRIQVLGWESQAALADVQRIWQPNPTWMAFINTALQAETPPSNFLDAVVIGNVGIDTNIYLQGSEIDFSVEANFTENVDYIGQAGGYASRGFARLGKKTSFIGYIGQDYLGDFIRQEFSGDRIEQQGMFIDPMGTSRSVNLVYKDGSRKNFYDGKSHMHLAPDLAVCEEILSRAKLAHFNIPNWARYLLPIAKRHGLVISCDIQDVIDLADPYRQEFISDADVLFFSAVNQVNPTVLIENCLLAHPNQIILVGMGDKGCTLGTKAGIIHFSPVELNEPIIDTNGAGDSLAVGFLTSYVLDGYSLYNSVARGQIAARYACSLKANSSQLINREKLDSYSLSFS